MTKPLARDLVGHAEFVAQGAVDPETVVVAVEEKFVEVGGGFGEEIRPALVFFGMLSVCRETDGCAQGTNPKRGDVGRCSLHARLVVGLEAGVAIGEAVV